MIDLQQGDCLELMKSIPDGSVDMILCDLPYGTTANKWDIVIPFEPLWEQYSRVIKNNGAIVLFGSEPFSSELRISRKNIYRYDWKWDKVRASGFQFSHSQPMRMYEDIMVFYKNKPFYDYVGDKLDNPKTYVLPIIKTSNIESGLYRNNGDKLHRIYKTTTHRVKTNKLVFTRVGKGAFHPTQKPVPLLEYLIKTYTCEGETVLDNCMGSGSTGVAAVNLNRSFIGMELDCDYFKIAEERINNAKH